MQFLELDGGPTPDVMDTQRTFFASVREYLAQMFRVPIEAPENSGVLRVARRVFTEVNGPERGHRRSVLLESDPRSAEARRIERTMIVDHRINARIQNPDGTMVVIPAQAIRRGDFVEAFLYAVITHDVRKRFVYVSWGIKDVVRLRAATGNAVRYF